MRFPVCRWLTVAVTALTLATLACTPGQGADKPDDAPLYVALGASESVGTGARNPSTEGWVAQLQHMMPAATRLANLAVGGITLQQAIDQALPVAIDLQPTVVTVWLNVNDLTGYVPLDQYRIGLETLLASLEHNTRARVYVANIPDLTLLPAFSSQPKLQLRTDIDRWNRAIAEVASAHGATVVDLFGGWSELRTHPDLISRDGLHPSSAGHKRIAELFWQTMKGEG